MADHDREQCGTCMRDFLKVGMRQVTASGIYLCEKCYHDDPLRGDDGLWINDAGPEDDENEDDSDLDRTPLHIEGPPTARIRRSDVDRALLEALEESGCPEAEANAIEIERSL